ncbi:truncated nef protein [Simian immunodeficiency virus]|uniref:Truncated nef protein n=1 Tax=Simian immunodeficiency virus TaxID=11723 RepID=K4MJM3_SIV|nr:truncated nef protein [Simian immunodeficiency virus]
MGGNTSSKACKKPQSLRDKLLSARGEQYGRLWDTLEEGSQRSQGGSGRDWNLHSIEQKYSPGEYMNTPWRNPAREREKGEYG